MGHILVDAKKYVEDILRNKLPEDIHFHNARHTESVVDAVVEIGKASSLNEDELEIVQLAGWFHDVGFLEVTTDHEEVSARMAKTFLQKHSYPIEKANRVAGCILATKMPQQPKNELEKVICDADLLHLAKDDFFERSKLLRNELTSSCGLNISDTEWMETNSKFLREHQFFTEYARVRYEKKKKKNLNEVETLLTKMKSENETNPDGNPDKEKKKKKKDKKNKKKDKGPDRGIETMFRLTSKNHLDLSSMADNKANIMISINAIILSVLVSVLIRKLEEYPYLVIPTLILTLVCLTTIVLAILVTRPQVTRGKFTPDDITKRKVNLLFFGNFHSMKLKEYDWAMKEMMKDGEYLYSNLIQDIYHLGVVLGKKYRLLRISYTFFMFGFVISVISFLVAEMFFRSAYPY